MNSSGYEDAALAEEAEELPAAEKELAEDAPWKKIQQNTFTRWCNEHLKCVNKSIADLQRDLGDGLRLIALLEVLSQKKMGRKHHPRPNFRQMKLENVSVALEFLERERIKLVSIDSKAIVDGNLKLILGLVWTLILHYSISLPMWEEEEEGARQQTPKQRLLGWVQLRVPQLRITNFSRDWNDGRALGALVDNCAPGLCPDWQSWDPAQPVQNAREAMQQADDWLGVPQVIAPEEIADPNVDEHSVMTYLSQFPKAKLKPGAPLRPPALRPERVRAYGPGLEPQGNTVLQPARFTVETAEAGSGEVLVYVQDPEGHTEEAQVVANKDEKRTFSVTYVPKVAGLHKVTVLFGGQNIAGSPFGVAVGMALGDAGKVSARGPGIEPSGNVANKATYFDIYTAGAGSGDVGVVLEDPSGRRDTVEVTLEDRGDSTFRCSYRPTQPGLHRVAVTFAGAQIPHSPFGVNVAEACNPSACRAWGRGLQPKGVRVHEVADFRVHTNGAGSGELRVTVRGPQGTEVPVSVRPAGDGVYECEYRPTAAGTHSVSITWGGYGIPRSPVEVEVGAAAGAQKVRAWGPGLHGGVVGRSADFVVEAIGTDVGTLGFSIEGPSQAKIECDDRGDGSCDVRYWPTEAGGYAVHVVCNEQDIAGSPFMAHIRPAAPDCCPEQVKVWGPGLEPTGVIVNRPTEFCVDARAAGRGGLHIYAQDADGCPVDIAVKDNGDGTFSCHYVPSKAIKHTIIVTWGGVNVPRSPFRVSVGEGSHPGRVRVYGPGVERAGLPAGEPTYFTVDCSDAGQGDVSIGIKCCPALPGAAEADIDFTIIKNDNDTFTVKYTPPCAGLLTIMVLFGTQELPCSPFRITVAPAHDSSKVRAEGPGISRTGVQCGCPTHFTVQTRGAGKAPLDVQFGGAAQGGVSDVQLIDNGDYSHTVKYTALRQGELSVGVTYGGDPIPKSPFPVTVAPPLQLDKVAVQGLSSKVPVGSPQSFSVLSTGAGGQGALSVSAVGAGRRAVPVAVEAAGPGVHRARFTAAEEGQLRFDVTYDGHPVPGSPFVVDAVLPPDPSKVHAFGPGLHGGVAGSPATFTISTRGAGAGALGLTVEGPREAELECHDNGDGSCSVRYVPPEPGEYSLNILFAGSHVPGSPFRAAVRPRFDATKVRADGPGLRGGRVGQSAAFAVDCRDAGEAELNIEIRHELGARPEVRIHDNGDGTYGISYTPARAGAYTVTVSYGGVPVPHFPACVTVEPEIDLSAIAVYGSGVEPRGPLRDVSTEFTVDARAVAPSGGPHVGARLTAPSGATTDCAVTDLGDGTYRVRYTPAEEGVHQVEVTFQELPVPQSPFRVAVAEGCDPTRVSAHGPGLESGLVGRANCFTVQTRGAGTGGLGLAIEGPSEAKMSCQDNKDGSCSVEYVPFSAGDYDVNISFGGRPIPGSPFRVRVSDPVDASQVRCSGPGLGPTVRARLPHSVNVDCSAAGRAALDVKLLGPSGTPEPVEVRDNGDGTHSVTYSPSAVGPHSLSIAYGGQEVPRSPFKLQAVPPHDASRVLASGPGLSPSGVPASLPVEFTIDARGAGQGVLTVQILDPEGRPTEASIEDHGDGTFSVRYLPRLVGRYSIAVRYGGDDIPASPFRIHAAPSGDASKCHVTVSIGGHGLGGCAFPTLRPGERTLLAVDARAAGPGKVTCSVLSPDGAEVDVDVAENPDGTFHVSYTAPEPGSYGLTVRFGGQHVPNSPFRIVATAEPPTPPESLRPFSLDLPCAPLKGEITAEVRTPSGRTARAEVTQGGDGTVAVRFEPSEKGRHLMELRCDGDPLPGSPLQFYVDAVDARHVSAYGAGLSHGVVNKACSFTVCTKGAGEGGLSLAVEGPSKAELSCQDNQDGTCTVSYLPTAPGDYSVIVRFDGEHVPGSPFTAKITGDDSLRTSQLNVGTATDVSLKISETDLSQLTATIRAPSGSEEPCLLKRLPNRHIGISFTPKEVGEHVVSVRKGGQHVTNSPFKIVVGPSEIGDAERVKVWGAGLSEGRTFQLAQFVVDTRSAGYGGLGLSVEGPSKVDIHCEDAEDGTCKVSYCPTEPGSYRLSVKFAERHVPGSPFTVKVSGEGRVKESITRSRQAASIAAIGSACDLNLKIPGNWFQMVSAQERLTRTFTRSSHTYTRTERTEISKTRGGETTREVRVQESTRVGAEPFHGVFGGFLGGFGAAARTQDDAAPPELSAQVLSPSGQRSEAEVQAGPGGAYRVRFVPEELGAHSVAVKFRGQHVPGSPFPFTVGPLGEGGAHRARAGGPGLQRGVAGVPAEFSIWTREAGAGGLSIAVEGPSKAEINFEDRKDGSCGVTYLVQEPGDYEVSIKFNEEHIPDSPFVVPVASRSDAAQRITVSTAQEALQVNQPAALSVHLNGARGVIDAKVLSPGGTASECSVSEIEPDVYSIGFLPLENGVHAVEVRLNGRHVPGSPFNVRVGEQSHDADPGLVTAYGAGLQGGVTGVRSEFVVKTANAGAGALSVTIDGPSKVTLDCVECADGHRVTYTPMAPGNYLISIKYGGPHHIVGSPFKAKVTGPRLSGGHSLHETSSVLVETVTRGARGPPAFGGLPKFSSDASKVVARGPGLSTAFVGQKNHFTVDCSKAGSNMLMVGVHGPKTPCEEVYVKHVGNRLYNVTYTVKEKGDYVLILRWGDDSVPGSPFRVTVP